MQIRLAYLCLKSFHCPLFPLGSNLNSFCDLSRPAHPGLPGLPVSVITHHPALSTFHSSLSDQWSFTSLNSGYRLLFQGLWSCSSGIISIFFTWITSAHSSSSKSYLTLPTSEPVMSPRPLDVPYLTWVLCTIVACFLVQIATPHQSLSAQGTLGIVCPVTCEWAFGLCPVWVYYNRAAINIHIQIFVWTHTFTSPVVIPTNWMTGSCGRYVQLFKKLPHCFLKSLCYFTFHCPRMTVPVSLHSLQHWVWCFPF